MKRALLIALSAAALTSCATSDAVTYDGSALARAGHPAGYRYSPASGVKSGSCHVEISSSRLVAFGCPSEDGVFVEYRPLGGTDHCEAFRDWAIALGSQAKCSSSKSGANGSALLEIDGTEIHATLSDGTLRVTKPA